MKKNIKNGQLCKQHMQRIANINIKIAVAIFERIKIIKNRNSSKNDVKLFNIVHQW